MEMLKRYPHIKNIFIKHNTAISTSDPLERLFSQAALILTVRRNKLSDSFLKILILEKIAIGV
jgi:transcriptional/translational regulatory protein YebC/TACO1